MLTKSKFYFAWSVSDATCNIAGFGYRRPDNEEDEDEDDLSSVQLDVHTVVDHEVSEHVIVINLLPLLFSVTKLEVSWGNVAGIKRILSR